MSREIEDEAPPPGVCVEGSAFSHTWLQEVRRRRDQIASGEVEPLDEDEMFARIEARRR